MSWTSPFTVASTTLPRADVSSFSMNCSRWRDGGLHRLGALQHFGDDQLVGVEQPADLVHAGHQRAVDDVERRRFLALEVEVGDEAVLRALDDVVGEALVERAATETSFFTRDSAPRKCAAKAAIGIVAAVPEQVFGELALSSGMEA